MAPGIHLPSLTRIRSIILALPGTHPAGTPPERRAAAAARRSALLGLAPPRAPTLLTGAEGDRAGDLAVHRAAGDDVDEAAGGAEAVERAAVAPLRDRRRRGQSGGHRAGTPRRVSFFGRRGGSDVGQGTASDPAVTKSEDFLR
ncbi:MAG: hypothetical protein R6V44_07805 [Paracoccaceae bacterium]